MERVVNRADLADSDASSRASSPSPVPERARRTEFEFVQHSSAVGAAPDENNDDEELDFVLFAPSSTSAGAAPSAPAAPIAKIRLASPDLPVGEPGILRPRDSAHYLAAPLSPSKKDEYAAAALSGAQVRALAATPWPGAAYPWRTIHIPATRAQHAKLAGVNAVYDRLIAQTAAVGGGRKRKGKAARIKIRTRIQERKAKAEGAAREKEERELAEKEKRTRRNREKKVKRKMKEKAKKAAGGDGAEVGGEAESGSE